MPTMEAPDAGLLRYLMARPSELRPTVRSTPSAPIKPENIGMPNTAAIRQRRRKRRRFRKDGGPK